jgi:hypothetical protein
VVSVAQSAFNFDAPPVDPHVHPNDVRRLTGQSAEILKRLRQGPATNAELNRICYRYSARIHDLRQSGYRISGKRIEGGLWLFRLDS